MTKLRFSYKFNLARQQQLISDDFARRIGPFLEVSYKGCKTYKVDFNLGGGYFRGWTIEEMADLDEGVKSLMWIMDKDFPDVVKQHIHAVLSDKM